MHNVALRDDQVRDPAALRQPRELWPVVGRDPERTPMQWDATRAAGFLPASAPAAATPWLPLAPDYTTVNAAAQSENATSTLSLFRLAAALRRAEPALRGAPLVPLDWAGSNAVSAGVVAFARPLRCACGNVTRQAALASDDDQPEESGDDYDSGVRIAHCALRTHSRGIEHRLTSQFALRRWRQRLARSATGTSSNACARAGAPLQRNVVRLRPEYGPGIRDAGLARRHGACWPRRCRLGERNGSVA